MYFFALFLMIISTNKYTHFTEDKLIDIHIWKKPRLPFTDKTIKNIFLIMETNLWHFVFHLELFKTQETIFNFITKILAALFLYEAMSSNWTEWDRTCDQRKFGIFFIIVRYKTVVSPYIHILHILIYQYWSYSVAQKNSWSDYCRNHLHRTQI